MLVLVAELTIKPGLESTFERTMTAAVPHVREEPGNHRYLFHRSKDDPRLFLFYEQYADRAAFEAHMAHLKQMDIDLISFCEGEPKLRFFDLIA